MGKMIRTLLPPALKIGQPPKDIVWGKKDAAWKRFARWVGHHPVFDVNALPDPKQPDRIGPALPVKIEGRAGQYRENAQERKPATSEETEHADV